MRIIEIVGACIAAVALAPRVAHADTLKVPQQFATIQAAAIAAGPGDVVRISSGTYHELVEMHNLTDVTFKAVGKVTVKSPAAFVPNGVMAIFTSTNVALIGLRLVASGSDFGVRIESSSDCRLERCRIDGGATGVFGVSVVDLSVKRCTIGGSLGHAIELDGDSATIAECRITNAGDDAIHTSLDLVHIAGNTVKSPASSGIFLALGSGLAAVEDNSVTDAGAAAIVFEGPGGQGVIASNRIRGGVAGIDANAGAASIEDNRIDKCAGTAITLKSFAMMAVGNRASKCGRGLSMTVNCDGGAQTGNAFIRSQTIGVEIDVGANGNLLAGNVAKKSGQFDLVDHTGGANTLVDNRFGTVGP